MVFALNLAICHSSALNAEDLNSHFAQTLPGVGSQREQCRLGIQFFIATFLLYETKRCL